MVSKTAKSWLQFFGIGAAVLGGWIFIDFRDLQSLAPPPNANTLASFAEQMPAPKRVAQVDDDGVPKIVWVGDTAKWALVSGPPCYVFDASGKLIEWNASTGDVEPTTRYLQPARDSDPLTAEQAIALAGGPD